MNFFALPKDIQQSYIIYTAEQKNDSESNIEKDIWVTKTLSVLFNSSYQNSLAFKGGTSLSKGWSIIFRFSEDIDLIIDSQLVNPQLPECPTKSEMKKFRRDTENFVCNTIKPLLENELLPLGATVEFIPSEIPDPTVLQISYPFLFELDTYNKGYVQLEISSRSTMEALTQKEIRSEVCKYIAESAMDLDDDVFSVNIVEPYKTCLEKIFLLHEEFSKSVPRSERMSRHLYDLYKLNKAGYVDQAIADTDLYCHLIRHRFLFNRIHDVNYKGMHPSCINIIPPASVLDAWKNDYEEMKIHMINEKDDISWDDILKSAQEIMDKIHSIPLSEDLFLEKTEIDYLITKYSELLGYVRTRNFKQVAQLLNGRELTLVEKRCINEILKKTDDRKNFEIITKTTL